MKYKLIISYDGANYSGWQMQRNASSIQQIVQSALSTILRHPLSVIGSGRTDAGVHALAQVAHFTTDVSFNQEKLLSSLNGLLPPTIRALHMESISSNFHARYSAIGKIYRYCLHLSPIYNPFTRAYRLCVFYPIHMELLQAAAQKFLGTRDFTSFSNESHRGSAAKNPIRTLKRLEVVKKGPEVFLEFEGNGFLYKMVRNIVGTLLDVARGKRPLGSIEEIFAARDRRLASATSPPHALFLVKVLYENALFRSEIDKPMEFLQTKKNESPLLMSHFEVAGGFLDKRVRAMPKLLEEIEFPAKYLQTQ